MGAQPPPPEALMQHAAFLRGLSRRLLADPGAADDAVQDAWLAALEHPPRRHENLRGWLATTLRRLAGRVERGRGRRARRERAAARPEAVEAASDAVVHEETLRRVTAAVLELAEDQRRVVLQRYYAGLTAAEIARREGIPAGTVRARLSRALDELRGRLDREFGDRDTWSAALVALGGRWRPEAAVAGGMAAVTGGLAMSTIVKAGAAAAVVAALVWIPWRLRERDPEGAAEVVAGAGVLEPAAVPDATDGDAVYQEPPLVPGAARRALVPEQAAAQARAVFRIQEWDGTPNAGALVVQTGMQGEDRTARTDQDGVVELAATGETDVLIVERRAAPPHKETVELVAGERTITLPRGRELSGRIVVDGGPPPRPMELQLYSGTPLGPSTSFALSSMEWVVTLAEAPSFTRTDATGRFRFVGLAEDWRGNLRLPYGHALPGTLAVGDPYSWLDLSFAEPRTDVAIEVERFPGLRARIVCRDGTPATEGRAQVRFTWLNGTNRIVGARADVDGVVEFFHEEPIRSAWVNYWEGPGHRGETWVEIPEGRLPEDGDVGDLVLAETRDVVLVVLDTEGRSVAGAVTSLQTPATDEDGRTVIEGVSDATDSVRVSARGFLQTKVELPGGAERVEAILERTNEVRVRVVEADGGPLAAIPVFLLSTDPLFAFADSGLAQPEFAMRDLYEGTWHRSHGRSGSVESVARTDELGRLSMGGILPGLGFTLQVRSAGGQVLAEERVEPLGKEGSRELTLAVGESFLTFRGTVRDERGQPIHGASVKLSATADVQGSSTRTDAAGRFTIPWVVATEADVTVAKEGYLTRELARLPLGEEADFTLVRGRVVTVSVVDEAGRDLAGASLSARGPDGKYRRAQPVSRTRWELSGLPDSPLEVTLRLAGATYTRTHDPLVPELRFVVPVHGAVELTWDHAGESAWQEWLHLDLVPRDDAGRELRYVAHDTPAGTHAFPLVLPGEYELVARADRDDPPLVAPVPVTVAPDRTTRVTLP